MRKWQSLVGVTACLAAMVSVGARQQQRGPAGSPGFALTALDYYQIQQLYARMCHGLDSGAENGQLFAQVFTADGVYTDTAGATLGGHGQLAALARNNPRKGPTNVGHYVTNVMIEPSASGATGRSYLMIALAGEGGQRASVTEGGRFRDELVKTADGWRIRSRTPEEGAGGGARATTQPSNTRGGSAAAPAPPGPSLTVEDYAEIQQLYARYGFAWDGAAENGTMFANLFTPDGSHLNDSRQPSRQFVKGRDRLVAFALQDPAKHPTRVGHFVTNVMLEPSPEGVLSKAYLMRVNVRSEGQLPGISAGGIYFDLLAKTPVGWRFKAKQFMVAYEPLPDSIPAAFKNAPALSSR
jgi:hypothetical protein